MRAFRIVKKGLLLEAFSGEGARAFGGRWNLPGVPIVYAAQTRALAALEALAHFAGAERRIEFVTFAIDIAEALALRIEAAGLPRDWRSAEPGASTQQLGSDWQRGGRSAALVVPSVLIPQESCVLLNPEHPDIDKIMVSYPEPFEFDRRL
ncbi:MAG: RES domain-containing protein [Burkholderiales bacterium]|nr:RES domain-containing protein [Burkholderiales bacterium]